MSQICFFIIVITIQIMSEAANELQQKEEEVANELQQQALHESKHRTSPSIA